MKPLFSAPSVVVWVVKLFVVGVIGAAVLTMSSVQSVTVHDFTVAFSSIPLVVILAAEFVDKISDRFDYANATARMLYGKSIRNKKLTQSQVTKALFISLIFSAFVFFMTLYVIANTITFNLSTYTPGTLLSAAIIALYIIAPETGNDELLLMLWLATQFATHFANFTLIGNLPI